VNAVLTAAYWEIGRRIVEFEQAGETRAGYGEQILENLAGDLNARFGRGFSRQNLQQMRQFYLAYLHANKCQTVSGELVSPPKCQTVSGELAALAARFPLPWSAYVRLLALRTPQARTFYETEALRGGWSVRQLDRQIESQFYERTLLSRNKSALLRRGTRPLPTERLAPEEAIKDPFVLEFLGLKDEYSESELEDALIRQIESFLLELGTDFAFVARQKRLRLDDEWFRVDLVLYHRRLRCLVLIDLKLGRFTHADAGQMHLYLNYARDNWTNADENPPVGIVLCAQRGEAVARYALEGLPNKVMVAEYRTTLPDTHLLEDELRKSQAALEQGNSPWSVQEPRARYGRRGRRS
jgi:predicted nuclease of restriction endonuclease-like (RecB) superfamily